MLNIYFKCLFSGNNIYDNDVLFDIINKCTYSMIEDDNQEITHTQEEIANTQDEIANTQDETVNTQKEITNTQEKIISSKQHVLTINI